MGLNLGPGAQLLSPASVFNSDELRSVKQALNVQDWWMNSGSFVAVMVGFESPKSSRKVVSRCPSLTSPEASPAIGLSPCMGFDFLAH